MAIQGSALPVGGQYKTTPSTSSDGDTQPLQQDINGNAKVVEQYAPKYEDNVNGVAKVEQRFTNTRCTGDTLVKSGSGHLHAIIVSQPASATPTAGVLTLYDNTAESGTVIFQHYFPASAVPTPVTIPVNGGFTNGCYVGFDGTLAGLAFNIEWR